MESSRREGNDWNQTLEKSTIVLARLIRTKNESATTIRDDPKRFELNPVKV